MTPHDRNGGEVDVPPATKLHCKMLKSKSCPFSVLPHNQVYNKLEKRIRQHCLRWPTRNQFRRRTTRSLAVLAGLAA